MDFEILRNVLILRTYNKMFRKRCKDIGKIVRTEGYHEAAQVVDQSLVELVWNRVLLHHTFDSERVY